MLHIAIQGQPASFHDQAAHELFDEPFEIIPCSTFAELFETLHAGKIDFAVSAIENSLYGTINEVYDLLRHNHAWIFGEQYLHITQNLIALPGVCVEDITEVYSHPVALAQCSNYLDTLPHIGRHEHEDTAGAVADIKKWGDPHKAAIAGNFAAAHHSLPILQPAVENDHLNYTRFVALARQPSINADASKTSLILDARHAPGALASVLAAFAAEHINLTMLTSRPIIGDPGHYRFYIDVDAGSQTATFKKAQQHITSAGCHLTILGSYQAAPLPWNAQNAYTTYYGSS